MKTKKAADIIFAVFFTVMFLLTLFADDLYRLTLPKVAVEEVKRRGFPDGTIEADGKVYEKWRTMPAMPKKALRGAMEDMVYAVNETGDGLFLVEYFISTGEEADGYIEVTGGVLTGTMVVIGSDREVHPGQQILITDWDESVALHTAREREEEITPYAKNMRKSLIMDIVCVAGAAAATVVIVLLRRKFCKGRWKFLRVPVLILWCVLVCWFFKTTILLPGEWIPGKLIDWDGWRANMERFPF